MTTRENLPPLGIVLDSAYKNPPENALPEAPELGKKIYDPELLYVECHMCGKPVLWEQGKTTELLFAAGVDISMLDAHCMIVSESCPSCSPHEKDGYSFAIVRIAGLSPEEAAYMSRPSGHA